MNIKINFIFDIIWFLNLYTFYSNLGISKKIENSTETFFRIRTSTFLINIAIKCALFNYYYPRINIYNQL